MDTVLLIDGENIKGKIKDVFKELDKEKPDWHEYDFKSLFDKVLGDIKIERKVFYFAKIKEHDKSVEKSKKLRKLFYAVQTQICSRRLKKLEKEKLVVFMWGLRLIQIRDCLTQPNEPF